jgi:hypothetical protein
MDISFSITAVLKASARRVAILGECLGRKKKKKKQLKYDKTRTE